VPVPRDGVGLGVPVLLGQDAAGVRPTLRRDFPAGHPLALQCEVASREAAGRLLPVRARLVGRDGTAVREALAPGGEGPHDPVRAVTLVIETGGVPAGDYRLVVDVPGATTIPAGGHVLPVRLRPAASGDDAVPTSTSHVLEPLSVAHGPLTRHAHRGPLVIRTEEAWVAFWKALPTRQRPPDIDFSRATLLAIVSDDDGVTAAAPVVDSVRTEPGGILVRWRLGPVAAGATAPGAERRRPFVVVGLPGLHGQVRFERVE
jgi:hypothetical protein